MRKSLLLGLATAAIFSTTAQAGTLDDVKKAGVLKCGVGTGLGGFSAADEKGTWHAQHIELELAIPVGRAFCNKQSGCSSTDPTGATGN